MVEYVPRMVDPVLDEIMANHAAVLLVGPRACGKTTTAQRRAKSMLRLNRASDAVVVRSDPDAALSALPKPLLIDEWQMVPEVLGAVKQAVDEGAAPGSFLLTGSVRADLGAQGWPMTGRVIRQALWGLSARELAGSASSPLFLDRVEDHGSDLQPPPDAPDLRGYVEVALRSGFPSSALTDSDRARRRFLGSYVDEVVNRDVALAGAASSSVRVRRYLQALAASTAGAPVHKSIYDAAAVERVTAVGYDDLLEQLMVTERLPAWATNRLSRVSRLPKRHLVDPALVQPLLGVDARTVLRDADLLGRLIESFVVAQLRVEASLCDRSPQLFHLRDANGRREIDVIVEFPNGDLIAIEVKASASPDRDDARHLRWLRNEFSDRRITGVVFHVGKRPFRFEPDIHYLPIATLWA